MNRKMVLAGALVASLSGSAVAHALCVELTDYRPWDPTWLGAAIGAASTGAYAALRGISLGNAPAARFRSDTAGGLETTTNGARSSLLVVAESSSGDSTALRAENYAQSGAVVQLIGASGALIDAYAGGQAVFRVANDGIVTVRGQPILQKGPPGTNGADAPNGVAGSNGNPGADQTSARYPACVQQSCNNVCTQGVGRAATAPCSATGAGRFCELMNGGGNCCECLAASR